MNSAGRVILYVALVGCVSAFTSAMGAATMAATAAEGTACSESGNASDGRRIDLAALRSPVILDGDSTTAYRDPAVIYRGGVFRLYCTVNRREDDGRCYLHTAVMTSRDLLRWTHPQNKEKTSVTNCFLNFGQP